MEKEQPQSRKDQGKSGYGYKLHLFDKTIKNNA